MLIILKVIVKIVTKTIIDGVSKCLIWISSGG